MESKASQTGANRSPLEAPGDWVTATAGDSGFRTEISIGHHTIVADEPLDAGGTDEGATPYELLLAAVGSCTAMTMRMYATRKGWPLERVAVHLRDHHTHAADCETCDTKDVGLRRIERRVELHGPLTDEQRARLMLIADRCPVKQTVDRGIEVVTESSGALVR